MCKRGRDEEEGGQKKRVCVCVFVRAGVGGGWEGFPLSHKADGADVSGCSQSQQGQVYPAAVWKSRDSSSSRSPLRIPLLTSSLPAWG